MKIVISVFLHFLGVTAKNVNKESVRVKDN